ncbi:MAG: hypothetical protein Q8909_19035 [Bacteroidota bacterium]|nr:hypothetical protein [Bacteroidota bacterium]
MRQADFSRWTLAPIPNSGFMLIVGLSTDPLRLKEVLIHCYKITRPASDEAGLVIFHDVI